IVKFAETMVGMKESTWCIVCEENIEGNMISAHEISTRHRRNRHLYMQEGGAEFLANGCFTSTIPMETEQTTEEKNITAIQRYYHEMEHQPSYETSTSRSLLEIDRSLAKQYAQFKWCKVCDNRVLSSFLQQHEMGRPHAENRIRYVSRYGMDNLTTGWYEDYNQSHAFSYAERSKVKEEEQRKRKYEHQGQFKSVNYNLQTSKTCEFQGDDILSKRVWDDYYPSSPSSHSVANSLRDKVSRYLPEPEKNAKEYEVKAVRNTATSVYVKSAEEMIAMFYQMTIERKI